MATNVKIAVDIFRQKWFRQLPIDYKVLWLYLMCESNFVGVFEIDSDSWSFSCAPSKNYKDEDAFYRFGKRIQKIPNHPEKGIIVGKLDYQKYCGQNSKQWEWVLKALSEVDLTYEKLQEMKSHEEEQMEFDLGLPIPEEPKKKTEKELRNIIPPQEDWVRAYCDERHNGVDVQRFMSHYTSNGWLVGKVRMRDWQAAVRNWEDKPKKPTTAIANSENLRRKF